MTRAAALLLIAALTPTALFAAPVTVKDATGARVTVADTRRIVSVNPAVTEALFALGVGSRVVGVDVSSASPPGARKVAQVGYQRALAAEGLLALAPSLVVGTEDAGPPAALDALRASRVPVLVLGAAPTVENARARIRTLALVANTKPRGDSLIDVMDRGLENAKQIASASGAKPRVLFLYTRGNTAALVSGGNTPADAIIALAGGVNAVTGFDGYRPLTAESMVAAAPDVVLIPDDALQALGGVDGLLAQPGLSLTPAGKERRVLHYESHYLLGFGPRLGDAASDLARALHPGAARP